MSNSILAFSWRRNSAGYEWLDGRVLSRDGVPAHVLVARHAPGARNEAYGQAQTPPILFRDFAACDPTEDGFRQFADRWGLLGDIHSPEADAVDVSRSPDEHYLTSIHGEMFQTWLEAHFHLKSAVALWDMLNRGDLKGLQQHIRWGDDADGDGEKQADGREKRRAVVYDSQPELQRRPDRPLGRRLGDPLRRVEVIASRLVHPERLAVFSNSDVVEPARFYLGDLVTTRIRSRTSLALDIDDKGRFIKLVRPTNLLGYLWVQLLDTIAFKKVQNQCSVCGTWFEIQGFARKDKAYCSNACRNRAYRERQEKAARLDAEAVPLKEIAEQLGSDVPTIRGWLKAAKKKDK